MFHGSSKLQFRSGEDRLFFHAVENEDSTLHFPENTLHKANAETHKSLNRINKLIQEAKFRIEQEWYYSLMLEQVATGIVVMNEKGNVYKPIQQRKSNELSTFIISNS